jgi:hypothetical protein
MAIASSSSAKGMIDGTGPKISQLLFNNKDEASDRGA